MSPMCSMLPMISRLFQPLLCDAIVEPEPALSTPAVIGLTVVLVILAVTIFALLRNKRKK